MKIFALNGFYVAAIKIFRVAVASSECSNATDCSLSIFGGFSGSDRHSVSLTTGMQLSKINQFAISTYFFNALAQVWANIDQLHNNML